MLRLPRRAVLSASPHIAIQIQSSQHHPARPPVKRPAKMNATQAVLDWIAAHPYQTAFQVANGIIICTPAAATVPVLAALGFGASGPTAGKTSFGRSSLTASSICFRQADELTIIAGSTAAAVMSYFGTVPAAGWFAIFQSAAMGGYGASAAASLAQAGAALSSVGGLLWSRNSTSG